jgi:superfamily II DNA/RNA helicase
MKFDKLKIQPELVKALKLENIETSTKIQQLVIPEILENKDLIAESETGTGKTLAFLLPIFQLIDLNIKNNQVIILAPTHELAMQIHSEATTLAKNSALPIKSQPIIGNVSTKRQLEKLKLKPQIIVGTPGRIADLIIQKKIKAHTIKSIIVDEADLQLTNENSIIIKNIISFTKQDRQLLFFSATFSKKSIEVINQHAPDVQKYSVRDSGVVKGDIEHLYFEVTDERDKLKVLRKAINALNPHKAIIFVKKNNDVLILAERLKYHNLQAVDLHGCNNKQERQTAFSNFKEGKIKFLIASDIAARGLDVKDVSHVFNFNLPFGHREYIHRVGRTGRAGQKGVAISFVSGREIGMLKRFSEKLKINFSLKKLKEGEIVN